VKKPTFYIVDVFAEEKFAGNQLAVFRSGAKLTSEQMQSIAREMHFSETTFIMSEEKYNGGYEVRIFTPVAEVPFAGHPTLGNGAYHSHRNSNRCTGRSANKSKSRANSRLSLRKKSVGWSRCHPKFGKKIDAASVAEVLGLRRSEIDERFPVEEVSTGLPHIIVPLKKIDSLNGYECRWINIMVSLKIPGQKPILNLLSGVSWGTQQYQCSYVCGLFMACRKIRQPAAATVV